MRTCPSCGKRIPGLICLNCGDDEPISRFAKEQGILFYEHDFFVVKFFPNTSNLEKVLSDVLVYDDRAKAIIARYWESGIGKVTFIALQLEELGEPGRQKSVVGKDYKVYYLGRFPYLPLQQE